MNNIKIRLSILIIGHNSIDALLLLLKSINRLFIPSQCTVEIIYVDDGSTDASYECFNQTRLVFEKISFRYKQKRGRVYAVGKAVSLASGEWLILLQSNVIINSTLIKHYYKSIQRNPSALAFMGIIQYQSSDMVFQNYLNHKKRGINQYQNNEKINPQHLLFGNCCLHRSTFIKIKLNFNLKYYGGEELDFAYYLNKKYPGRILCCSFAGVLRNNFPTFQAHCKRLEEYGANNLIHLNSTLQKNVIKWPFLLYRSTFWKTIFTILCVMALQTYRMRFLSCFIIKIGMLSAIMLGYQKSKWVRKSQTLNLL